MTRAQSAKKPKKSDILTSWRVNPKGNNKIEIRNLLNEHDASIKENTELAKGEWTGDECGVSAGRRAYAGRENVDG